MNAAEQLDAPTDDTELVPEPVDPLSDPDETGDDPDGDEVEAPAPTEPSPDEEPDEALDDEEQPITEEAVAAAQGQPVVGEMPDGMSPEQFEKEHKRIDKAAQRYHDTVVTFITETEQPLIRCECCLPALPGFMVSPIVQPPSEQSLIFARTLLGEPPVRPLAQAPTVRRCPVCDGWGDLETGSRRNSDKVIRCSTCQGHGYLGDGPQQPSVADDGEQPLHIALVQEPVPDAPNTDPWGRAPDHPGYMIFPHDGMAPELRPPGMAL